MRTWSHCIRIAGVVFRIPYEYWCLACTSRGVQTRQTCRDQRVPSKPIPGRQPGGSEFSNAGGQALPRCGGRLWCVVVCRPVTCVAGRRWANSLASDGGTARESVGLGALVRLTIDLPVLCSTRQRCHSFKGEKREGNMITSGLGVTFGLKKSANRQQSTMVRKGLAEANGRRQGLWAWTWSPIGPGTWTQETKIAVVCRT